MTKPTDSAPATFDPDVHELSRLVAREIGRGPEATAWSDPRFVEFLSRAAREADRSARRMGDDDAARRGRALLARAQARGARVGLQVSSSGVKSTSAPVRGTVTQVLRAAQARHAAPLVDLGVAAGVGRELWDEVVDQWVDVSDELPDARYVAVRIVGDSMTPLMHTGDTVLVRVGPDVRTESIIVARHPDDGYVCKRVRAIDATTIELESLDQGRPMVVIPRDPSCVVGTVLMVWCSHHPAPTPPL